VLLQESISFLDAARGGLFFDGTVGLGGHSEAILGASKNARVIGTDRDPRALAYAQERLASYGNRFCLVHARFHDIEQVLRAAGESDLAGVLVDLGVSSLQLDAPERGFSFRVDAPLDMRMDTEGEGPTAADLLESLPEQEIARIIYEYGEERRSRRLARRIVERREQGEPIKTTRDLAELVARTVGHQKGAKVHPATRTFQALRIAVNEELEGLDSFVETAVDLLQSDGRFVAISFHSLEDRIVKRELRRLAGQCQCPPRIPVCACGARRWIELLTRRPVTPSAIEVKENPRARSARLRAGRKLVATRQVANS